MTLAHSRLKLFAESGYLLSPAAVDFLNNHDVKADAILTAAKKSMKETIVLDINCLTFLQQKIVFRCVSR